MSCLIARKVRSDLSSSRSTDHSLPTPAHQAFPGHQRERRETQIWCAVATYVLIAIVKKELHLEASLYTSLQILSVSVFEKTQLSCALRLDEPRTEQPDNANQLMLFDF